MKYDTFILEPKNSNSDDLYIKEQHKRIEAKVKTICGLLEKSRASFKKSDLNLFDNNIFFNLFLRLDILDMTEAIFFDQMCILYKMSKEAVEQKIQFERNQKEIQKTTENTGSEI